MATQQNQSENITSQKDAKRAANDYAVENLRVPCGYYFPSHSMVLLTHDVTTGAVTLGLNPQCCINYSQHVNPCTISLYCDINGPTAYNLLNNGKCVLNYIKHDGGALYKTATLPQDDYMYKKYITVADIVYLCSVLLDMRTDRTVNDVRHFTLKVDKIYTNGNVAELQSDGKLIHKLDFSEPKQPIPSKVSDAVNYFFGEQHMDENMIVYIASRLNPNIFFTKEACDAILATPYKNKKRLVSKCVKWGVSKNITLITDYEVGLVLTDG